MDGMRKLIFYPAQLPIHNLAAECCFSFINFSKIFSNRYFATNAFHWNSLSVYNYCHLSGNKSLST